MVLILSIAIVFDISEKLDDFQNGAKLDEIIFDYYVNFIAFYGNLFSALILFISTIWFTSRITANSEVVAILTSGTSFRRLLRPYWIGATIICLISLALNHLVVPQTNIKRIAFEEKYVTGVNRPINQKVHRQVLPGHYVYFRNLLWHAPQRVPIHMKSSKTTSSPVNSVQILCASIPPLESGASITTAYVKWIPWARAHPFR